MKKYILILAVALVVTGCKKSHVDNPQPTQTSVEDLSRQINIEITGMWGIHDVVVTRNSDTISQYIYINHEDIPYHTADANKGDVFTVYTPSVSENYHGYIKFSTIEDYRSVWKRLDIKESQTFMEYTVK